MKKYIIKLDTISAVQDFTNRIANIDCDIDLSPGKARYTVDAKSILGILSLSLDHALECVVHSDDENILAQTDKIMSDFE